MVNDYKLKHVILGYLRTVGFIKRSHCSFTVNTFFQTGFVENTSLAEISVFFVLPVANMVKITVICSPLFAAWIISPVPVKTLQELENDAGGVARVSRRFLSA
jgi:hypothetical protein